MLNESDSNALTGISYRELWAIPRREAEAFQLQLLQQRFATLKDTIATLRRLADIQGVHAIDALADVVPVLFQHTAYKSYPLSLLERGKFRLLTQWLDKLTTHDLSAIDTSGCQSIDDWLQLLDEQTPLLPVHSSGTSGKLSLIPRDHEDAERFATCRLRNLEGFGEEQNRSAAYLDGSKKRIPIIYPSYRYGRYGGLRNLQVCATRFDSTGCVYTIYDELMSADVASLAGHVQAAETRGELDQLEISPHLLQKYRDTLQRSSSREEQEARFIDRIIADCQGREVIFMGVPAILMECVRLAQARGIERLFDPASLILTGGGAKGVALPEDWRAQVERFVGARPYTVYAMTECSSQLAECDHGNYHSTPLLIPFVLDPATGEPLPRSGVQTGRFAWFDLLAESYWGGFITGDEVTAHWDEDCPCGRHGMYVEPAIQRYSDKSEDGNDKINCAGATDAHERALDFLNELALSD